MKLELLAILHQTDTPLTPHLLGRQWIGKDFFKGANQTWYDLAYSSIWDSEGDNYDNIRATFNYDFDDHMSLLVKTSLLNSAYYNSTSAFFGFDYRF